MRTNFDLDFLATSTDTLRAMAHPIRLAMIDILYRKEQLTVTEIFEELNIQQAIASHHLRILKDKNILLVKRAGKNSIYTLRDADFHHIVAILTKVV
jgi:DNA-binding transcriptional ArsR family regulator